MPTDDDGKSLLTFVHRGGRVVVTGMIGALLIGGSAIPDVVHAGTWKDARSVLPSPITQAAPTIRIAPAAAWQSPRASLTMYAYDDDPIVVEMADGDGEVFWWCASTPLTNAGLSAPGNLAFVLATLGPASGRRVFVDEYFHGARPTIAGTIWHTAARWVVIQIGLITALVIWTFSRRSGPVVIPAAESRLSPLEFVRTLGSLYQRAGANSVAVEIALKRLRASIAKRLGMTANVPLTQMDDLITHRWPNNGVEIVRAVRAAEAAAGDPATSSTEALAIVQTLNSFAASLSVVRPKETS